MENFKVDQSMILGKRKIGVSGMMRVKNDAEFIEQCVESCLPALDELVIVYNDCTDNSPQIIESLSQKYPDKIKSYHYEPKIFAWNLTPEKKEAILKGEIPAENTLAGYYNFALSKTTRKFVMKIDADQIYFSEKLKGICDQYRSRQIYLSGILSLLFVGILKIYLSLASHCKFRSKLFSNHKIWKIYNNSLKNIINAFRFNVSLSGINVVIKENSTMPIVSLGKENIEDNNILPPYNGEGDHKIFRVTDKTYFMPYFDERYNSLNKRKNSVIEVLKGTGILIPAGIFWMHLNSCRRSLYHHSLINLKKYPKSFVDLDIFKQMSLYNVLKANDFQNTSVYHSLIFDFIHNDLDDSMISQCKKISERLIPLCNCPIAPID